uniref:Uncharacterized protein n=1 Tax=Megaviridae environmental sample TaxID=1737588 RepID=A0A5J6VKR5_9VIRU|nr:MAG: hypothetical protein [Megaviridae environmental sample]
MLSTTGQKIIKILFSAIKVNHAPPTLGRWKLKNSKEMELYINTLHADPGYDLQSHRYQKDRQHGVKIE